MAIPPLAQTPSRRSRGRNGPAWSSLLDENLASRRCTPTRGGSGGGLLSSHRGKSRRHAALYGLTGRAAGIPWFNISIAVRGRMLKTYRLRDLGTWVKRMARKRCRTDPEAKASRARATAPSPSAVLAGKPRVNANQHETRQLTGGRPPRGYTPLSSRHLPGRNRFPRKLSRRGFRPQSFCVWCADAMHENPIFSCQRCLSPNRRAIRMHAIRMQTLNGRRQTDGGPRR
jgi:hypothetical protein